MKKIKFLLSLFVLLFVAGVVVGCKDNKPKPSPTPGEKEKTPEEKFKEAVSRFELPTEVLSDTGKFEGSFKLTKTLGEGADIITVKWETSDESVIKITDTTAKVFNPEYTEGEPVPEAKNAKLTATFTKDNFKEVKHFEGTLKPYLVKDMELKYLHDIDEDMVEARLKETTKAEKKTKVRVKNAIIAYIGEDRFDIVDEKGENRTPVYVGGSKGENIPDDIKVGDQIEFSHVIDTYFNVLQFTSNSKNYPVKTLLNIKVVANSKQDLIKVCDTETITTQAAITSDMSKGAVNYLKRLNNYSKIVKMMAKVVVTKKDDKYGIELEDPATGVRLLAYYAYKFEELLALDGKIIEFKAITAVDVRNPESIKDNKNSKLNGKYSPRIGVIEILNKDVAQTEELKAIWDYQKTNYEFYLKQVLGGKHSLLKTVPTDEKNGTYSWLAKKDGFEVEYALLNENDVNKDNITLTKIIDKGYYKSTVKYLDDGIYTVLMNVTVKKDGKSITYITGVEIDSKKINKVDNFDDLYKKNNDKLVYENKIVEFEAVLYKDGKGQTSTFLVKDKDNQNRVLEIRNKAKLDDKFVLGHKVKLVGTLTSYFGTPQLENLKLDKCEDLGMVEGFTPQVEIIDDKTTEEAYKQLDKKVNKLVKTTVKITEVNEKDKGGQTAYGMVGDLKVQIRLDKKLIGKLEKDSTYELNGIISVYKNEVQVKIKEASGIVKK